MRIFWPCAHVPPDAFSALTLLVGRQEGHLACKKTERWGAGVVICLELGADLYMAQWIPLPLTVPCFSKIQIDFTFLVPAHPGTPGQRAIKRWCVCVCPCTTSLRGIDTDAQSMNIGIHSAWRKASDRRHTLATYRWHSNTPSWAHHWKRICGLCPLICVYTMSQLKQAEITSI